MHSDLDLLEKARSGLLLAAVLSDGPGQYSCGALAQPRVTPPAAATAGADPWYRLLMGIAAQADARYGSPLSWSGVPAVVRVPDHARQ